MANNNLETHILKDKEMKLVGYYELIFCNDHPNSKEVAY